MKGGGGEGGEYLRTVLVKKKITMLPFSARCADNGFIDKGGGCGMLRSVVCQVKAMKDNLQNMVQSVRILSICIVCFS